MSGRVGSVPSDGEEEPSTGREGAPRERLATSRLTTTPGGRWLVSLLLVLTLGAVIASNMPPSAVRTAARPLAKRFVNITGLTQNWEVYAPDPLQVNAHVAARIDYADGSSAWWHPPRGDAVLSPYRTYRWFPTTDRLTYEQNEAYRRSFAQWLVRSQDHRTRQPVRVELIRRWRDLSAPGVGEADGPWEQETLYTLNVAEETT